MRSSKAFRPCALAAQTRGESGSAYIVVLLVLVVLTILGLSLALVTQTERQIGTSEKTIQRVFASAETGIALMVAKANVFKTDNRGMRLEFRQPTTRLDGSADPGLAAQSLLLRHEVETTVLIPLLYAPCNLCQVNSGGEADQIYWEVNHGLVSAATRRGWRDGSDPEDAAVLGRQRISLMIEIQPVQTDATPVATAYREELNKFQP